MSDLNSGWSQFGEDRWIINRYAFDAPGVFVDIGASDGITGNNSLLFEKLGWWCLCIEPDPRHWERLTAARPNCLPVAVSTSSGTETLWLHPDRPSHTSLVPSEDVEYRPIDVRTVTLTELISSYNLRRIDVIDIDVEGHELAVWGSLDLSLVRPAVVLIEYADTRQGSSFSEIDARLTRDEYTLVHRSPANLIYECRLRPLVRRSHHE
jgi:FkbM family methyltransferase